jgi:hypothetical protein
LIFADRRRIASHLLEASIMASKFPRGSSVLGRSTVIVGGALLTLGGLYGPAFAQTSPTVAPTVLATTTPIAASTPAPTTVVTGTPVPLNTAVGTPAPLPTAAPGTVSALPALQSESDLRVALNRLLEEHTYLAGQAIAPVIADEPAQAAAAAALLDANTQELGNLLGAVYGQETQQAFVTLWRRHLTDYVQYARAGLNDDLATQQQARQDLLEFAQDTDNLLSSMNPDLPAGTVSTGLSAHVQGTLQVIDALEAKDYPTAFALAKTGADMTAVLADPLAVAIATQFPDRFAGGGTAAGVPLQ